jgi:hypothetical protein
VKTTTVEAASGSSRTLRRFRLGRDDRDLHPSAKLPGDTEFAIFIEAGYEDLVGNIADLALEPWIFRTVGPPVVVAAAPEDGATGVAVDGVVDLEFDRLMDTASVEAAIRFDPPVLFRASWSGETVRLLFDPSCASGRPTR